MGTAAKSYHHKYPEDPYLVGPEVRKAQRHGSRAETQGVMMRVETQRRIMDGRVYEGAQEKEEVQG